MSESDVQDNTQKEQNLKQIEAIGVVYNAVKDLNSEAAHNVLSYVNNMVSPGKNIISGKQINANESSIISFEDNNQSERQLGEIEEDVNPEGINSVALKWLRRNSLTLDSLSEIFSLGLDDIDLVAKKIPGSGKAQKLKSVFLLKGVSAFLSTGAPRFVQEQVREAAEHYDAWDKTNSSTHIKAISSLVGGSASTGYTLTTRGLAEAVELIKSMVAP